MTPSRLVSVLLRAPLLGMLWLYRNTLGAYLPDRCRFEPTCSAYAQKALNLNGPVVGSAQTVWRLLRCGPWTKGGFDEPLPWRSATHRHRTPASR